MLRLSRQVIETPVGPMTTLASDTALVALEFGATERHHRLDARLSRWLPGHVIHERSNHVIATTASWLEAYFARRVADPRAIPLAMLGTPFERQVWERLLSIPAGRTRSYGDIAAELKLRNGARAVGLANGANPIAIIVPCHRVIGADGSLTGYGGGLDRKRWLLAHEGVRAGSDPAPTLF